MANFRIVQNETTMICPNQHNISVDQIEKQNIYYSKIILITIQCDALLTNPSMKNSKTSKNRIVICVVVVLYLLTTVTLPPHQSHY